MFLSKASSRTKLSWSLRKNIACLSTYSNVVTDMTRRGLMANMTSLDIIKKTEEPTPIYCGVDPTANSLHLGNLVTFMGLLHFHIRGHQAIAMVGGATGAIGDPSGKKSERVPLSQETLTTNVAGIEKQIHRFFNNGVRYAERHGFSHQQIQTPKVLNNYEWFSKMSSIDFLSDVGRYARVNSMLGKESVKSRMDTTQGISFTEFSYQLLQAYDFWHLYKNHGCRVQLGGSDQWGNITAGIDMIYRKRNAGSEGEETTKEEDLSSRAFGITIPLLVSSTGEKFGKSAGNAIWLDEKMTSYFDFYQFLMKTTDADVGKYLNMFTFLNEEQVNEVMDKHMKSPEQRLAQKALADETTELVHGVEGLRKAQTATSVLFGQDLSALSGDDIIEAFKTDANRFVQLDRASVVGAGLDQVAAITKAAKSKSDAQKKIRAGGFYLNNARVNNPRQVIEASDLIDDKVCVLRVGKSSYHLVHVL